MRLPNQSSEIRQIDQFEVLHIIGQGSQGTVYLVKDTQNGNRLALKLLSPFHASSSSLIRFQREFQAVSKLNHPGIVRVYQYGEYEHLPYLTMEYIQGSDLRTYLRTRNDLSITCRLMSEIANALTHIHANHLIHRDLKPSNILVTLDGHPKITDFGLVKPLDVSTVLTMPQSLIGTLHYISPEQLQNDELDGRSDLYSLGIIFFEMISGRVPYHSESFAHVIAQHLSDEIPLLTDLGISCPSELNELCQKLLAKDPWDRPATAAIVAETLNKLIPRLDATAKQEPAIVKSAGSPLRSRFINRHDELNHLAATLEPFSSYPFSVTLISGETGIGKSRLLREASVKAVTQNDRFIRIRATLSGPDHLGTADELMLEIAHQLKKNIDILNEYRPYLHEIIPLHEAFFELHSTQDSSFPEHESPISDEKKNPIRLLSKIISRLTQVRPWLVIIENLNRADRFLFDLIKDLSALSDFEPIHCAIWSTIRIEEFKSHDDAVTFLKQLTEMDGSHHIQLGPLSLHDAENLVSSMINQDTANAAVQKAAQLCSGSPMLLVETIRGWADQGYLIPTGNGWDIQEPEDESSDTLLPVSLQKILEIQLKDISETAFSTLAWIAALADEAYFPVIRLLDNGPDEDILTRLNNLIYKGFITVSSNKNGEFYLFQHYQVREMILRCVPSSKLRDMHNEISLVLKNSCPPFNDPARIAVHEEASGNLAAALNDWYQAGLLFFKSDNLIKAQTVLENFDRTYQKLTERRQYQFRSLMIESLLLRYDILRYLGNFKEHEFIIQRLMSMVNRNDPDNVFFRVQVYSAGNEIFMGHLDQAKRILDEIEPELEHVSISCKRLYTDQTSLLAVYQGDYQTAVKLYRKSLVIARKANLSLNHYYNSLWMIGKIYLLIGKIESSKKIFLFLNRNLNAAHKQRWQAQFLSSLAHVYYYQYNLHESVELFRQALEISRKIGDRYAISCNLADLGICLELSGKLHEALSLVEEAYDLEKNIGSAREMLMITYSYTAILCQLGRYKKALHITRETLGNFPLDSFPPGYRFLYLAYLRLTAILECPQKALKEYRRFSANQKKAFKKQGDLIYLFKIAVQIHAAAGNLNKADRILRYLIRYYFKDMLMEQMYYSYIVTVINSWKPDYKFKPEHLPAKLLGLENTRLLPYEREVLSAFQSLVETRDAANIKALLDHVNEIEDIEIRMNMLNMLIHICRWLNIPGETAMVEHAYHEIQQTVIGQLDASQARIFEKAFIVRTMM
ncbi:protein kinase [bacterium]|nr:protein kinase [candidate division CSSED10-310 bacterium]